MLVKMFLFEFKFFIKQPSFYITSVAFFTLPFLMMSINRINMAGGNTLKNSAYSIATMLGFFSAFAMFLVINFVANTALRNTITKMDEILYCKPIHPLSYQLGRFLGAYAIVLTVFTMVPLGFFVATWMPWVDRELLEENRLSSYLLPFVYLPVPTLLVLSCCFYALAIKFRSMMAVNLFALGLFIVYDLSDLLFVTPGFRYVAALLDPFGMRTFAEVSRYWSMFEKNNSVLAFNGVLLQNRLLWMVIGVSVMGLFGGLFGQPSLGQTKISDKKYQWGRQDNQRTDDPDQSLAASYTSRRGQRNVAWQQFLARTGFELRQVLLTPSFLILVIMLTTLLVSMLFIPNGMFGTPIWPLTQSMVRYIQGALGIVVMIVITFYSAEVIWREREIGMGDVIDSLPVNNLSFWLSKLIAVWSVVILLVCFSMLITISFQLASGYTAIDIKQYLISLSYFAVLPWCMLTVLAFLLQVVSTNKYMGMAFFVLFILSGFAMEPLGFAHNLFRFSRAPSMTYSDMNGFAWSLTTQFWYMLYWGALSLAMAIVGYGLWHRGSERALKQRFSLLMYQVGSTGKGGLFLSMIVFIASGSYIFYNTTILNEYHSETTQFDEQADYEKLYLQFSGDPVPTITRVNARVDIYPDSRSISAKAEIPLENKTAKVIHKFLVNMPAFTPLSRVTITGRDGSQVLSNVGPAGPFRTYWFDLEQPMQPGEIRRAVFDVRREHPGFVDREADTLVVKNGTFINNRELFPQFGYQAGIALEDRNERRRRDLPPPKRANKLEDVRFYHQNVWGNGSGFIDFETTISTARDQIAIAPGYLQRQWVDEDRAYFHYKMDVPISNFYAFLSARYESVKEQYNGVAIEVYHHVSHGINVPRMIESIKASLDYYSDKFGPYQHRQARIIEFPGYRDFAQSFANTIPYSERIGFFSDLRDPDDVDSVYFVTAHEMAHQWWGGQVVGANVQGNTLLSESLAHYSALRVTENKYGKTKSRKILQFELDRYLRERTTEIIEELPWMKVEDQPYIHYRKGVVVMNSIHELLGGARLNKVLKEYVADFRYRDSPYATTLDLKARLDRITTPAERAFTSSLFEQITLYDLKLLRAEYVKTNAGTFDITLIVNARRFKADGQGVESELALEEYVDIGLASINPNELSKVEDIFHLDRYLISAGKNTIGFSVTKKPEYAVLDPFVRLVDRDLEDNYRAF